MSVHFALKILTSCNKYNIFPKTEIWDSRLYFLIKSNLPSYLVKPTSQLFFDSAFFFQNPFLHYRIYAINPKLSSAAYNTLCHLTPAYFVASFAATPHLWLWKCSNQVSFCRQHNWPVALDAALLDPFLCYIDAIIPTGFSQPESEYDRDSNAGPFLRDTEFLEQVSGWRTPRLFLHSLSPFLFSLIGVRPALWSEVFPYILWFPLLFTVIPPSSASQLISWQFISNPILAFSFGGHKLTQIIPGVF